ncbi:BTAD domain-containing putative transcriptional regulator [Hydrogenophaga sp. RAC07]|uniref:BTAD domain-containing putative transcriptional regulator n=1 Tax=Hydrogenophaga sp. RAC07 TaxID=1842537 RepID=UPI00083DD144|nr:BTAD domain-containing putative transcriptional regulator [Hydrogenophaga sp. RAC07]
MAMFIQLLGVPQFMGRDGTPVVLRGHKSWGLLAYLVTHEGPASRHHLARLLFEDAEDPLAALRWNLTELRRALGPDSLRGESIVLRRDTDLIIDSDVLRRGSAAEGVQLPGLGRELLEGMGFATSPSFEVWLQAERRRMHATAQAVLHEATLARLADGSVAQALNLASRLVALDPLEENSQVLLVRCLANAGDGIGAARQVAACRELFQRELGVSPGPALSDALRTNTSTVVAGPATGRAGALALLEAGEAAISAGALDAGLQCLRRSIDDANTTGDPVLRARTRVALGSALVHAARGRDAEGATALHEALAIGEVVAPLQVAAACRELGYVEFLLGRYDRALNWVARTDPLVPGEAAEQARLATLKGSILSDTAHYVPAMEQLLQAQSLALDAADGKLGIYADSMVARILVLTGRYDEAVTVLDRCIDQSRKMWTAFLPWPQSFRAEADLRLGRIDEAAYRFENAFALGCQLADPCWEGIAGRGMGLVAAARGDVQGGIAILLDTLQRCMRLPDAYVWGSGYVLDGLCALALAHDDERGPAWVSQLTVMSARSGMRELVARSHWYRGRLGEPGAIEGARQLATQIRNPVLDAHFLRDA